MEVCKPPKALSIEGNTAQNWQDFEDQLQIFLDGSESSEKAGKVKVPILLSHAGPEAQKIYKTFKWEKDEDKKDFDKVVKQFKDYCEGRKNVIFERFIFWTTNQEEGEPIDHFLTRLKTRIASCEYTKGEEDDGSLATEMVRDKLIIGLNDDKLRERLLRSDKLTLEKAVEICRATEISRIQAQAMGGSSTTVHVVKRKAEKKTEAPIQERKERKPCGFCGTYHRPRNCPAWGKTCPACGRNNHFASVCRNKRQVNSIDVSEDDNQEIRGFDDFFIGAISKEGQDNELWEVKMKINDKVIRFKLDTGAQANVISNDLFQKVRRNENMRSTNARLETYSGEKIKPLGEVDMAIETKNKYAVLTFIIVDLKQAPILGLSDCTSLGLVKRVDALKNDDILKKYPDVFKGIGCIESLGEHHIHIDKNATPVVHAPRKVPVALRGRMKKELDRLESLGVIEAVKYPTKWVNSIVNVQKPNGDLRICLDPKDLNKAIQREHFQLPTLDEITPKLSGATMFSSLDASSAFHQIKLDKESSDVTCFNTPFGRYKFLRLPYGICSASEVFHRDAKELFKDIEGVDTFIDDILIWGSNEEEHDRRLEQVLKKCQEVNLKLNKDKCKIKMKKLKYLGHTLTSDGLRPDESKIQAILEMQTPKCKKDLQRFLGCVNYEAKFIQNLADITAPLRELLKDSNAWSWDEPQARAFEKLKKLLTEAPLLQYYDITKPVTLQCDSSKDGVGAVLKHEKPIAYASKSLTESQKRYAQIEKELYAVVFGCEHFHQFVYGRHITIHTDHKPLVSIVKKPLASAPARLQRLLLRLQRYDVEVVYVPGKLLYTADMLSRAYVDNTQDTELDEEMELHVNMVISSLPVSDKKLKEIREETAEDDELQAVKQMCMSGWPEEKEVLPALVRPYWNMRDEICVLKGLVLKGDKIIMPRSQRREMLNKVHASHMGNEVTKRRARDVMFWPGMASQIEDIVQSCSACHKFQRSNIKEPMIAKEVPSLPWKEVATDLFYWNRADYIVVVDYYSKYFEVSKLENTRSETIIHHMKSIFARHGIPCEVRSDNGPQYSSSEFKSFARQ